MNTLARSMASSPLVRIRQKRELAELIGFESRNKYEIQNADGQPLGFAAEQQKGFLGILLRQALGHWRTFEIHVFDTARQQQLVVVHPFRWFFQRLEVRTAEGRLVGAIQQRFSLISKVFDLEDAGGRVTMRVRAPFWKIWTFPITREDGRAAGAIRKKWGGILREAFTDADTFEVAFEDPSLTADERLVLLAAGIFVDLQYFEAKAD